MSETDDIVLSGRDADVGSVAIVTLNRPGALNSFNAAVFERMLAIFDDLERDDSVRVIVLTGAGRAFCAGADISDGFGSAGLDVDAERVDGVPRDTGGVLNLAISKLDTPVIAAINGAAVGVGLTMTLPCDIRIAARGAKYAFPFVRRGIVFDGVASFFLPKLVGFSKAAQWSLTGRYIDPEDALRSGLFAELHDAADILPRALELARDIAVNCSPEAVAQNKRLLRRTMLGHGALDGEPFAAHMEESALLETAFAAPDCEEGVRAFLEKREPRFADRRTQKP
ncbi:enoyl-CoA hydratase-related protein [uncultured Algimonas sp.]|uniref:enoyl-CoA hydratase-related protein n=1 Tax=uncultured Algimonas sp. TaxID=1547920 RepID=UPI002616EEF1|nr:enoyl-CoA hydratase-related protein [uncultured Algimonas sp.]